MPNTIQQPIDPTKVKGYYGDPDQGIYRYRVYFKQDGRDMEIDYFAHDSREANEMFDDRYPDSVHVVRVVNLTINPQFRRSDL